MKKGGIRPIPPFKTLEDEAHFWDTHDIVEEVDDGTLVGFQQANKSKIITVRFEPKYLKVLREQAFRRGLGPTTLVRMWVMEKLQQTLVK